MNGQILIQTQLLATKLFVPAVSHTPIPRPRLSTLLEKSLKYPLTLVSAPAGFGKTTFLADWTQSLPASSPLVGWVSLDEEDNDVCLFWTYVLAALATLDSERFTQLFRYLQSPQIPPLKHVIITLINLLAESSHALLAKQWQWAADLIEQQSLSLLSMIWGVSKQKLFLLRDWLKQLPTEVVHSRPRLCLACSWMLWTVAPQAVVGGWLNATETTLTTVLTTLDPQARQDQEDLLAAVIVFHLFPAEPTAETSAQAHERANQEVSTN